MIGTDDFSGQANEAALVLAASAVAVVAALRCIEQLRSGVAAGLEVAQAALDEQVLAHVPVGPVVGGEVLEGVPGHGALFESIQAGGTCSALV